MELKENIVNKYPVYIISKARHESMLTSRALDAMGIKHYIAIEPQDEENYKQALVNFGLTNVTLLVTDFSNHGLGPGVARNWCWEHAITLGAKSHWVMDDNIFGFYRLYNNMRIKLKSPSFLRVCEDFVDRFENVPLAGLNYKTFCPRREKRPPYILNSRIYSCLLIRNDCPHRWRGRYNEDTILSLDVLKDGDCTIQFNVFLQDKAATQTIKGGNTAEFYHAEGSQDKAKWIGGTYNTEGTINKSQMLVNVHPDVSTVTMKYGRWHHHVDYTPFKANKLRYTQEYLDSIKDKPVEKVNNYGMKLVKLPDDEVGSDESDE